MNLHSVSSKFSMIIAMSAFESLLNSPHISRVAADNISEPVMRKLGSFVKK